MTTTTETTTFNKRTYSSSAVRIGNWREDEALELVRYDYGLFLFVSLYTRRGILKIFSLWLSLITTTLRRRSKRSRLTVFFSSTPMMKQHTGETRGVQRGEKKWHSTRGRVAREKRKVFARTFALQQKFFLFFFWYNDDEKGWWWGKEESWIRVDDSTRQRGFEFWGCDGVISSRLRFCEEDDRIGEGGTRVHGGAVAGCRGDAERDEYVFREKRETTKERYQR